MSKQRLSTASYHAAVRYFAVGLKGSKKHAWIKTNIHPARFSGYRDAWEMGWRARDERKRT